MQRVNFGITYDKTDIDIGTQPAREIWDFVDSEGSVFETLTAQLSYQSYVKQRIISNKWIFNSA